jgi:hypothetical protein
MVVIPRALEVGSRVEDVVNERLTHGEVEWIGEAGGEEFALVRWSDFDLDIHPTANLKPLEPSSPFQGQGKQGLSPASAEIAVAPQVVDPDGRRSDGGEGL